MNVSFNRNFNSQPHKEADGLMAYAMNWWIEISTHSLTRRLTGSGSNFNRMSLGFQLTASQGG